MHTFALLSMDYQNATYTRSPHAADRGILPRVAVCLAAARSAGVPVIHVRVAYDEHYTLRINRTPRFNAVERERLRIMGSPETDFCTEAQPLATEPIITKGCVDPFIGTPLMELLLGRKISELYLGGITTNFVVESTARHASDSGFTVNVIEDICASFDAQMHSFSISKILPMCGNVCSVEDFQKRIRDALTSRS